MKQFTGRRSWIATVILRELGWGYKVFAFLGYKFPFKYPGYKINVMLSKLYATLKRLI
jgi:hypothetical protein